MAELLDLLNAYTEELKGIYGSKLLKVSLYGSYARGDNRQWSDVNVFVLVNCSETELAQYREKLFATTVDFQYGAQDGYSGGGYVLCVLQKME